MRVDFGIKYKDVLLDIEEGSHLTVEWYSTIFNESEIFRGSYSYAIHMKASDKNMVALGFPNFMSNRLARVSVDVSVLIFGMTWKNAKMDLEVSYERITGYLKIDNGIVADAIRENTLPDMFSYFDGKGKAYSGISMGDTVEAKKAHMLATATADRGVYPYAFPSMQNYNLLGERALYGVSWVNSFNYENVAGEGYHLSDGNFYCPSFYLVWLIRQICEKLGFEAVGSFLEHPEVKSWMIFNTGYYSGRAIKEEGFEILPARHLPKVSITNFFKILRNDLRVMIYFDSLTKLAHFEFSENVLGATGVFDFKNSVVDKTLKISPQRDKAFRVVTGIDEADELYKYFPYIKSLVIGSEDEKKTVEMSIGTLFMRSSNREGVVRELHVAQIGNVYEDGYSDLPCYNNSGELSINDFTFRLFSFRGMQAFKVEQEEYYIPYGTTDNKNAKNEVVNEWMSLQMDIDGSVASFSRMFYDFLVWTESVEFDAYVDAPNFIGLNPMIMGICADSDKSLSRFLLDRISFEPVRASDRLFTKVKGYLYHKVFSLVASEGSGFRVGEEVKPAKMIYVTYEYVDHRIENVDGTQNIYAYINFLFYADPFLLNTVEVEDLKVSFLADWSVRSDNFFQYRGEFIATGSNYRYPDEFQIFSSGEALTISLVVTIEDSEDLKYVAIN